MNDDNEIQDDMPEEEPEAPALTKPNGKKARRGTGAPAAVGVAPTAVSTAPMHSTKFKRQSTNADEVWNEIIQWLPSAGLTPYDMSIQARRVWPPTTSGESTPVGRAFGGEMVQGGETEPPGSALNQFVIRYIHLPSTQQAASYDLSFMKKSKGEQIAVGRMALPDYSACVNMLRAIDQQGMGAPPQPGYQSPPPAQPPPFYPPQPNYAPPPRQQPTQQQPMPLPAPQMPWMPPPGYGAPDPNVMSELAYLRGALGEALGAAREGRAPNIPVMPTAPAGIGGLSDSDVDRIAARVAIISGLGPKPPAPAAPPQTVAAPPPPVNPVDNSLEGIFKRQMMGITERLMTSALGSVEESIKRGTGIGAPPQPDDDDDTPPAQIVAPENPQDMMPWKVGDVGANWSNGSPVKIAISKETGNLDLAGLAFANPAVAEKAMDMVNGLGMALQDAIRKITIGHPPTPAPVNPAAQLVRDIPAGAVDANPTSTSVEPSGGGWQAP